MGFKESVAYLCGMTADDDDDAGLPVAMAETAAVATVLQAAANQHRLQLLLGLYHGVPRTALVDTLPISESGVSNHLRVLADADLVYRGEDGWQLSPLGRWLAAWLDEHVDAVATAVDRVDAAEQDARDELAEVPLADRELEHAVTRRKWGLAGDVEDLLESADPDE